MQSNPQEFVKYLQSNGINRFYFYTRDNKLISSHPLLQPIADELASKGDDYDAHEAIFVQVSSTGVLQSAAVHRTCRGPGAGGVRNWIYNTVEDFLRDGLRLAKGMTHKNALAGIWWGGGKGVMARNTGSGLSVQSSKEERFKVYQDYGEFMSLLAGCYVTAEDVGTSVEDMAAIFSMTRHTTCIPPKFGGSGNPSVITAHGVLKALEATFDFHGKPLAGSTIAVQGAGHVGIPLIHLLFQSGVGKVIASDIDSHRSNEIKSEFSGKNFELHIVDKDNLDILYLDVDAVCPCATGGILNPNTIPLIKTKIVCGAANNQLLNLKSDDKLLASRGITYIPDFLANRMGIVNCCDEHMGIIEDDPKLAKHLGKDWDNSIYNLTTFVLKEAQATCKTMQDIAIDLAEKRSFEINPIYGHRGIEVIKYLVKKGI